MTRFLTRDNDAEAKCRFLVTSLDNFKINIESQLRKSSEMFFSKRRCSRVSTFWKTEALPSFFFSGTQPESRLITLLRERGNKKLESISVQVSRSVVSDSLWPHGLQHARLPCPSPTPGVYSNSCRWCHPTIVLCRPLLLSPSIFPSIRATQDGQVMVESSDKTWSAGEGNGKPRQYSTLRTPWTVWKGKKIGHWKKVSQETEY